jgi:hypothetical protein
VLLDGGEPRDATFDHEGHQAEGSEVFFEASISVEHVGTAVPCPGISVFSISPALLGPGEQAQLEVATLGPPATVQWTVSPASAGELSSSTALTPTFSCAGAGVAFIKVTVGLASSRICSGVRFTTSEGVIDCRLR